MLPIVVLMLDTMKGQLFMLFMLWPLGTTGVRIHLLVFASMAVKLLQLLRGPTYSVGCVCGVIGRGIIFS